MRVAVLSDIHGNWPAFQAVLDDARDVDRAICLGDVVGYGGDPLRCVDELRGRAWPTLVGNHDRACTNSQILSWFNDDAAKVIRWTRAQLGEDRLEWLGGLPETLEDSGLMAVHASPRDPIFEYILDGPTALANLSLLADRVCFHGHSHIPGRFYLEAGRVDHGYSLEPVSLRGPMLINPGSVGQPRDGIPDASYGVWDIDQQTFEWRRVAYDRAAAQRAILKAKLPARFATRLDFGR